MPQELRNILEYVFGAFETMFGNEIMRDDFISSTKEIIADKNTNSANKKYF